MLVVWVQDIVTGSRGAPVTAGRASAHADAPASIPVETKWISRTAAPPSHVRRGNVTCARCVQVSLRSLAIERKSGR